MTASNAARPRLRRALSTVATIALALGGVFLTATPANAASFTVSDGGDTDTVGTLRYALLRLDPGVVNTIDITYTGTITAATDLPDITESVVITGPGEGLLTIGAPDTVFTITAAGLVTITDLTLTSSGSGCGILATGTDIIATNVTASDFDCNGIDVTGGSLSATDVTVERNGTGIAFLGADASDTLSLTRVEASGAAFSGVNAVVTGGSATVADVTADDSAFFGFYLATTASGTSAISGVQANRAGAIGIIVITDDNATATLDDSTVDGSVGQGFNLQATAGSTLTASRLSSTGSALSGIWLSATDSGVLDVRSPLAQDAADASGIWVDQVDDATLTISGATVLDNASDFGGGLFVREVTGGATLSIVHSIIEGNVASDDGGGIAVDYLADDDTSLVISDSTISGNHSADYGGGVFLKQIGGGAVSTARALIQRTTIDDNSSTGYGAGVAVLDPAPETTGLPTVLIDGTTLSNNSTPAGGGGLYFSRTSGTGTAVVKLLNSTVSGNSAQVGGAVQAEGTSGGGSSLMTTVISNSTLTRNSANTSGGVDMNSGDQEMVIDNSIIADNGTFDLQLNSPYVVTFSLVQRADPAVVLSTADGNILGVAPRLGPLADNGGSTRTHLPLADSPVVDAGDPAITGAPATDQRGSARIVRVIDLGAVEVPAALAATGRSTDPEPVLAALLLVLLGTAMITGTHLRRA